MLFHLLGALIIGLIVGALAKLIVPGRQPGGCLATSAIGIAGSFIAFYIARAMHWTSGHPQSLTPMGFLPSLGGAILLLIIYHLIFGRRA